MRLVMVTVLAGSAALPLGASAQAGEESEASEPDVAEAVPSTEPALEEPEPSSEPAPEEPALKLELDDAGVRVAPGYPPRFDDLEPRLKYMKRRVRAAKIGLGVSAGVLAGGAGLVGAAYATDDFDSAVFRFVGGVFLMAGGLIGVSASAAKLARNKQKLRELQEAHHGTPRRVQWDLARSRLVF